MLSRFRFSFSDLRNGRIGRKLTRMRSLVLSSIALGVALLVGCSASKDGGTGSSTDAGVDAPSGFDVPDGAEPDLGIASDTLDGAAPTDTFVYGNSQDRLYRLDATSLAVTDLGGFVDTSGAPIDQMTDIALDKDGDMYGVTFGDLYSIDYKGSAPTCTHLATLDDSFNGLTFVPAGLIDAKNEVLVGVANDGGWWRIDVTPGASAATRSTRRSKAPPARAIT